MIARANHRICYPSRIQLIAAMNPCRCGGGPGQTCRRGPRCAADYQSRISGPLFDRIDLIIDVGALSAAELCLPPAAEGSAEVRDRVTAARAIQQDRYGGAAGVLSLANAHVPSRLLEEATALDDDGRALMELAAKQLSLSARGFHRALRVARTIADLDGSERVGRVHLSEALSYRSEMRTAQQAA